MKQYIQKSLMLSSIIFVIVTFISFLCFEYKPEIQLNFMIVFIAFLSIAVHYITAYVFHNSFLKEIIFKYISVEIIVLVTGIFNGWFVMSNWWMSFIYVTPVFLLAYFFGIVQIKSEVKSINDKLAERKKIKYEIKKD